MVAALTSALAKLDVRSTVYATAPLDNSDVPIHIPDAEVHMFRAGRLAKYWPGRSLAMRQELDRTVSNFDAVHIHELWHYPNYAASRAASRADVPYVISPLGGFAPTAVSNRRLKKWLFSAVIQRRSPRFAAAFHAMTEQEASDTTRKMGAVPIDVVPLGVDGSEFDDLPDPGGFDELYPQVRGKFMVLFLGRLNKIKGLDILIDGFGRAAQHRDDLHLVIAGPDGGYESAARDIVSAASFETKISFLGPVYEDLKLLTLSRADLFALTSYGEGFSVAVLEALGASLPVIISTQCHLPVVATAEAGYEIGLDPGEFADALTSAAGNTSLLVQMGTNARRLATEQYSWETVGASFRDLYRRVTGQ